MNADRFFPGTSRRATISSVTLQPGRKGGRKIKVPIHIPLSDGNLHGMPEWVANALTAVSQSFTEVEPEIQQIADVTIQFNGSAPGSALFDQPDAQAPNAELRKFIVRRTGKSDDPEVELHFNCYVGFARDLWRWLGEMGGSEVYISFPSAKAAIEVVAPSAQESFVADRPELSEEYDAEFSGDPRLDPPELNADYEKGVAESLGVPPVKPRSGRRSAAVMVIMLCLSILGHAQAPVAPPEAPAMTDTEKLALDSVKEEFQRLQQATLLARQHLAAIERDITREHHGFHLDENTLTLVEDAKPAENPAKVEPKPVEPKK